jgi:hypothetical protein
MSTILFSQTMIPFLLEAFGTNPKECLNRDMSIFVVTPSSEESKDQLEEYLLIVTSHKEPRMRIRLLDNDR